MSIIFPVSDVRVADAPSKALDRDASLRKLLHQPVEAMASSTAPLIRCSDANAFVAAAEVAFFEHRPLTLSPDAVWLCLARGFAEHVNLHAEELRSRFVRHGGKVKLVVKRLDFELGQPNPWPGAFAAFSEGIAAHVGKLRDLVVADFSTTGPTERAASEVTLMDGFQAYFEYEMLVGCGIPAVTLLGTTDDWRSIRRRASIFSEYGLERWTKALLPVLDELIRAAEGDPDIRFWQSFFRYESGSRGSELTGWIHTLFPHLRKGGKLVPNPHLETWSDDWDATDARLKNRLSGPHIGALPAALSSVGVSAIDVRTDESHKLRFVAGMWGVVEDAVTGAVSPEIGWAVIHGNGAGARWNPWRVSG